MWNWKKVQSTGNYKYLCKYDLSINDSSLKSGQIWESCYNSFLELVGLGKEYERLLQLKKEWLLNRSKWLINEDYQGKMKSKLLAIDIEGLNTELKTKVKGSENDTTIIIEENLGIKLDLKKVTVKEYYDYIAYFTKKAKSTK